VDVLDEVISDSKRLIQRKDYLENTMTKEIKEISEIMENKSLDCLQQLDVFKEIPYHQSVFEELTEKSKNEE